MRKHTFENAQNYNLKNRPNTKILSEAFQENKFGKNNTKFKLSIISRLLQIKLTKNKCILYV